MIGGLRVARWSRALFAGIAAAFLCLCGVAWLSFLEEASRRSDLEHETQVVAHQFSTRLRGTLEKHVIALRQMASFLETDEVVTEAEFHRYGLTTIRQVPLLLRISRLDPSLRIRSVTPPGPNQALVGFDTRTHPLGHEAIQLAMRSHTAVFSSPLRLIDGPRGFLLAVPVFKGGRFEGEVVGTIRGSDFVASLVLPAVLDRYEEVVINSGQPLLPGPMPEPPPESERPTVSSTFSLGGVPWEVRLTPRLQIVEDRLSSGRAGFWTLGLLFALMAGGAVGTAAYFAFGLALRARTQDEALRQANKRFDGAVQQLVQAERLSALGELVAGVAHEINNPLASIMGYLQLLLARDLPAEVKRRLETVYSEAERMARIIKNLLTFGRKHPPEKRYLGLNGIVEKALELKAYHFRVNQIRVETDLAPGLPMTMLDFHQVQQVLINLSNNAEQAMAEQGRGGTLRLQTGVVCGRLELRVSDTGPGILPDVQPHIFEPFYTTKKEGKGTGLGLSLCYGIMQEHGGGIRAESRPGHGATFVLDFPIVQAPVAEPQASEARSGHSPALRILIVDGEQGISDFLVELLTARGHRVDTASDVPQALQKIARAQLDLIISDMRLPQGSGRDIHRAAALKEPRLSGRIVFTTGDGTSEETRRFVHETGTQMVVKPCTVEEIERAIARAMGDGEITRAPGVS
jgi:signal transduction histidine kinase/ActR/RegA family two-component response regulator